MVAGQLELLVHILKKLKKSYLVVIAGRGESGPEVRKNSRRIVLPNLRLYLFYMLFIDTLANIFFLSSRIVCVIFGQGGLLESGALDGRD
jgi:hypothetical protein